MDVSEFVYQIFNAEIKNYNLIVRTINDNVVSLEGKERALVMYFSKDGIEKELIIIENSQKQRYNMDILFSSRIKSEDRIGISMSTNLVEKWINLLTIYQNMFQRGEFTWIFNERLEEIKQVLNENGIVNIFTNLDGVIMKQVLS